MGNLEESREHYGGPARNEKEAKLVDEKKIRVEGEWEL